MKINPFDYVKAINDKTKVEHLKDYNPYLANGSFSQHLDTIMLANEMNKLPRLPARMQFEFLYNSVRRGRRYGKWYKEPEYPHLDYVMEYYGYSKQKALDALQVLTQEQLKEIVKSFDKGGRG
jgi:hypothetical protein